MSDQIRIDELRIASRLGVEVEERARPQSLAVSLVINPARSFQSLDDRIGNTVDYAALAEALRRTAAAGERNLLETLAEDLARTVVGFQGVRSVTLEVKKFVLPDCGSVSAVVTRAREG